MNRLDSTSMTSAALSLRATRIARQPRVNLIDHVEHPEPATIMGPHLAKVIGPDVIARLRWQSQARAVPVPDAATLGLPGRDLQAFAPPDGLDPLVVDQPTGRLQHGADLPVAVAAVLLPEMAAE